MPEQIIEATVADLVDAATMYVTAVGPDGPIALKVPRDHAFVVGDPVHVKVHVRHSLIAREIGAVGSLGALASPFAPDAPPPVVVPAAPPLPKGVAGVNADGLFVPNLPDYYVPNPVVERQLHRLFKMAEAGITVRILIRGNTGVGKTSLILNECHRRSLPMTMTEGGEINSPEDWFGETRMNEHGTYFIPRPFTRGVETTNCVNFMDELPRVRTPQCLNPLMGLMSDLRSAYCHSLDRAIVAAPGTMFVATANVGRQFTGNITIDDATLNRFSYTIDMDYLPQEQEQKLLVERCQLASPTARSLVNFARSLRDQHEAQSLPFAPSTRTLIDVANLITWGGANPQEAVEEVIFPRYRKLEDDNDALNKVELSLQGQFPAPTVSMPAPGGHDAPGRSADSPADADPGDQATAFFAVTVTDRQAQSYLKPLHRNEALQQAFLEKLRATGF